MQEMNLPAKVMGAFVGFFAGSLVLLLLFYFIQFTMELFEIRRARIAVPVKLFVLPLITAFVGFKVGPTLSVVVQDYLGDSGPLTRFLFAAPIFWAVVVLGYVQVFEPFGRWISEDEWILVAKIILFPIGVLWAGALFFMKFVFRE
jgi:hypothetical protein